MKIGFIIICRYNSSRLPGKILMEINGKPVLQYIIERLEQVASREDIVVATSDEKSEEPITKYCIANQINYFRGSLTNVAQRFLDCAIAHQFDFATRINGDNLFVDIESLRKMKIVAESEQWDFISNVKNRTFPKGMSIEMVRTKYYAKLMKKFSSSDHYEHVTLYLYENDKDEKYFYYYNEICPEAKGFQLAIDTTEDFLLAEKIIHTFTENHTEYGLDRVFKIIQNIQNG